MMFLLPHARNKVCGWRVFIDFSTDGQVTTRAVSRQQEWMEHEFRTKQMVERIDQQHKILDKMLGDRRG